MSPKRPDLILSTHIPHVKLHILVRDRLDVEPHRRDRRDVLVQLQLVQYRRLARGVQPQHQQPHLLRPEDLAHHLGELASHCVCGVCVCVCVPARGAQSARAQRLGLGPGLDSRIRGMPLSRSRGAGSELSTLDPRLELCKAETLFYRLRRRGRVECLYGSWGSVLGGSFLQWS
jgi:hypothetical protein